MRVQALRVTVGQSYSLSLSYGDSVEILEPLLLCEEEAEEVRQMNNISADQQKNN